jgi:hypothetical protein
LAQRPLLTDRSIHELFHILFHDITPFVPVIPDGINLFFTD